MMRRSYSALGRLKPGQMNKTEASYAEHLEARKLGGHLLWWAFEPLKLRLADGCFYAPDFACLRHDRALVLIEVKGKTRKTRADGTRYDAAFSLDDSKVKLKVAAETFPCVFVLAYPATGGGFHEEEV